MPESLKAIKKNHFGSHLIKASTQIRSSKYESSTQGLNTDICDKRHSFLLLNSIVNRRKQKTNNMNCSLTFFNETIKHYLDSN